MKLFYEPSLSFYLTFLRLFLRVSYRTDTKGTGVIALDGLLLINQGYWMMRRRGDLLHHQPLSIGKGLAGGACPLPRSCYIICACLVIVPNEPSMPGSNTACGVSQSISIIISIHHLLSPLIFYLAPYLPHTSIPKQTLPATGRSSLCAAGWTNVYDPLKSYQCMTLTLCCDLPHLSPPFFTEIKQWKHYLIE